MKIGFKKQGFWNTDDINKVKKMANKINFSLITLSLINIMYLVLFSFNWGMMIINMIFFVSAIIINNGYSKWESEMWINELKESKKNGK